MGVTFFITQVADHPLLGCPNQQLPAQLLNSKLIHKFLTDRNGRPYNDHKCALRCLAHFKMQQEGKGKARTGAIRIGRKVEELWLAYCVKAKVPINRPFPGIQISQLHLLEDITLTDINVFRVTVPEGEAPTRASTPVSEVDYDSDNNEFFGEAAMEGTEESDGLDDMYELIRDWEGRSGELAGQEFLDNNQELFEEAEDGVDVEEEEHQFNYEPANEAPQVQPVRPVFELVSISPNIQ